MMPVLLKATDNRSETFHYLWMVIAGAGLIDERRGAIHRQL